MRRDWMTQEELGYMVGCMFRNECKTEDEIAQIFDMGVADVVDILRNNKSARHAPACEEFRVKVARDFHFSGSVRKAQLMAERYYVSDFTVRDWAARYPRRDIAMADGRRADHVEDLRREVRELRDMVMKLAARVDLGAGSRRK